MKQYFSKKWLWLFVPLLILPLIITDSGFCYSERRWLDKLELVDRALYGAKFYNRPITLTHAEKVKFAEEYYSSKYPEFCKVNTKPFDLSNGEYIVNIIFGRKLYEVECIYPLKDNDRRATAREKYYWSVSSVDACAAKVIDTSGSSATEREYRFFLSKNKNLNEGNEK